MFRLAKMLEAIAKQMLTKCCKNNEIVLKKVNQPVKLTLNIFKLFRWASNQAEPIFEPIFVVTD